MRHVYSCEEETSLLNLATIIANILPMADAGRSKTKVLLLATRIVTPPFMSIVR